MMNILNFLRKFRGEGRILFSPVVENKQHQSFICRPIYSISGVQVGIDTCIRHGIGKLKPTVGNEHFRLTPSSERSII